MADAWTALRERRAGERAAAPPRAPPEVCSYPKCRTALRVNNLSGICRLHRNKVTSRARVGLVPTVARKAGSAGNALRTPKASFDDRGPACAASVRPVLPGASFAAALGLAKMNDLELRTAAALLADEMRRRGMEPPENKAVV